MRKRYLIPEELQQLDPTGSARAAVNRLRGEAYSPLPAYMVGRNPSQLIADYTHMVAKTRTPAHEPYWSYWDEMAAKCGRQGGHFDISEVERKYEPFFANAQQDARCEIVCVGRDYLIRRIRHLRDSADITWPQYIPVTGTYSGLPVGAKKGEFDAESVGMHPGMRHLLPVVPGVRRMRGKDRVINQDANPNVRYIEREAQISRGFLRKYFPEYFGAWLNPMIYVKPTLSEALLRRYKNIEIDFTHMDESFNRTLALQIYYPVVAAILGESLTMQHFLTEVFEVPIFMGTYLLEGHHNWLSGIACTQDAETVYSVCLLLGAMLVAGYDPQRAKILAIGDDSILCVPNGWKIDRIWDNIREEAKLNAMQLSEEKCRFDTGNYRFCRNVYYTAGRRTEDCVLIGAYPSILCLNNIVQPERVDPNDTQLYISSCQRLDNAWGSPDAVLLWQFVTSKLLRPYYGRKTLFCDGEDYSIWSKRDWWQRVYGEVYSPKTSPYSQWLLGNPWH